MALCQAPISTTFHQLFAGKIKDSSPKLDAFSPNWRVYQWGSLLLHPHIWDAVFTALDQIELQGMVCRPSRLQRDGPMEISTHFINTGCKGSLLQVPSISDLYIYIQYIYIYIYVCVCIYILWEPDLLQTCFWRLEITKNLWGWRTGKPQGALWAAPVE